MYRTHTNYCNIGQFPLCRMQSSAFNVRPWRRHGGRKDPQRENLSPLEIESRLVREWLSAGGPCPFSHSFVLTPSVNYHDHSTVYDTIMLCNIVINIGRWSRYNLALPRHGGSSTNLRWLSWVVEGGFPGRPPRAPPPYPSRWAPALPGRRPSTATGRPPALRPQAIHSIEKKCKITKLR